MSGVSHIIDGALCKNCHEQEFIVDLLMSLPMPFSMLPTLVCLDSMTKCS